MDIPANRLEDIRAIMALFEEPGSLAGGGVTRLGYGPVEDEMHRLFRDWGERNDLIAYTDAVGNSYLENDAASLAADNGKACVLIGSHLDSVVSGGRFDGVAGVAAGMACLKWLKESGLNIPLRVAAFRCEESASFGRSTVGSGLVTGAVDGDDIAAFQNPEGRSLAEVFDEAGYDLHPQRIEGIEAYFELHIEQGKVLENLGKEVGIVEAIAGPRRFRIVIDGQADHSGATPMDMRSDALCAAAELILAIEKIGQSERRFQGVATVGIIKNSPNVMNVIPGWTELGVDTRGISAASLDRMEERLRISAENIARERGVEISMVRQYEDLPRAMAPQLMDQLEQAARSLGVSSHRMMSGAGHDALGFAEIVPTAMLFIPCRGGISHNAAEFTTAESITTGALVLYEALTRRYTEE